MAKRADARHASAREWRDALLAADTPDDADRTVLAHSIPHATLDAPPSSAAFPQELIERLQTRLASHVRPVASLLMKRACAGATNIDMLRERLAAHLPNDAARRDFGTLFTRVSSSSEALNISAQSVNEAASRLTTYLGPIARIVARRAAASSADMRAFHARLFEAVPEQHRAALRREWGIEED